MMQTFLPYFSFSESAKVLDNKRLGKQRVETWQIYRALTEPKYGWKNHPIVRMWKGFVPSLLLYGMFISLEWKKRGFKDTMYDRFRKAKFPDNTFLEDIKHPPWLGREDFHASHRSNLLRKNPKHYSKFGWKEPDNLPYVWCPL